jgi:hypothetical protein
VSPMKPFTPRLIKPYSFMTLNLGPTAGSMMPILPRVHLCPEGQINLGVQLYVLRKAKLTLTSQSKGHMH